MFLSSTRSLSSVLIAGVNTRPIVKSAKALGLRTIVVDCFDDVDLNAHADVLFSMRSIDCGVSLKGVKYPDLFELSLRALETYDVDAILLTSGMEHDIQSVKKLAEKAEIIGNKISRLKLCEDKKKLFQIADKLGINYPQTKRVGRLSDALKAATSIGYPVVLKPAFGGGGIGVRLARSPGELENLFKIVLGMGDRKTLYVQEYITGINASASILSDGNEARCLTVNEQVIGDKRLGVPRPFGYCGNITPLDVGPEAMVKIAEYSEAICQEIGLVGSNGADFVLSGNLPYLMEINTRFQSTIDSVEGLLGVNLVREHIRACEGKLGSYCQPRGYSAKLILYAKRGIKAPDLRKFTDIVDITPKGRVVSKGHPICSILKFGKNRGKTVADAYSLADEVSKFEV